MIILLVDIGSTFTKVVAIDPIAEEVLGTALAPTTVASDVRIGLTEAVSRLEERCGRSLQGSYTRVSSSAAGGLRMVALGLVPSLTTQAAQHACLGAGAKVIRSYSYELSQPEVDEINTLQPELLLLVGGTDGGDRRTVLHNARRLGEGMRVPAAVLVAANKSAAPDAAALLTSNPLLEVAVTENVMPELNQLNLEPARAAIREIFLGRITSAKGIDRLREGNFDIEIVMPTPRAVLEGAELLSVGSASEPGLGDLVVLDIGGATTDVHSIGQGTSEARMLKGLPEPFAKRTVEGDLGLRYNALTLLEAAGGGRILSSLPEGAAMTEDGLAGFVARVARRVEEVPAVEQEEAYDAALAIAAGGLALERHAGRIEKILTLRGPVELQYGKDLTAFPILIGTGGIFAHGRHGAAILAGIQRWAQSSGALVPAGATPLIDRDYLLFAGGLLRGVADDLAIRLLKRTLVPT